MSLLDQLLGGPHGCHRLSVAGYTHERIRLAAQAAAFAGYSRASRKLVPNQAVSPQQLQTVFGEDQVQTMFR
jgi:hypothetical protein